MIARILDGKRVAAEVLAEIKVEAARLKGETGLVPCLATVLVGDDPASRVYIRRKIKTALELGFKEFHKNLPADVTEETLIDLIQQYNRDPSIHGLLVQLPLPSHVSERRILLAVAPHKDVDGFHPINMGKLLIGERDDFLSPCTPAGIRELLVRSGIETNGAEIVIVGRSNIVGKPMAAMLMQRRPDGNATVTVTHTHTRDLENHCRRADVLIVAAGIPNAVPPHWIKPGASVIDVGIHQIGENINPRTHKKIPILRGDVDYEKARAVAGAITPVPGGVGPMTIAMLMKNTLKAAVEIQEAGDKKNS